jgi:hypothetical protein
MSSSTKDGTTIRDQLNNVWRQTGIKPKELDQLIELPESCKLCWNWFLSLNRTRPVSMQACAITYLEIKAFFDLQGIEPQPEEVDMIVLFDSIAMKVMQEEHKRKLPKEKGKEE